MKIEFKTYAICSIITLFLALEGTLIEGHGQVELSIDDKVICNNNESNDQIERYLRFIYSNINTPFDNTEELKQSYLFDCKFVLTAKTPNIYYALTDNIVIRDINQLSSYVVSTLFKSLLATTSVTSLSAIIVFGTIATILKEKFWKIKNQRNSFTQSTKKRILAKQKHKCAHCNRILVVVDFDHKNGNRADSREVNCQALCPNCHAIKTRQKRSKAETKGQRLSNSTIGSRISEIFF
jgi:hypothetical protein